AAALGLGRPARWGDRHAAARAMGPGERIHVLHHALRLPRPLDADAPADDSRACSAARPVGAQGHGVAGAANGGGRADGILELSRHFVRHAVRLLRLGARSVRTAWPPAALPGRSVELGHNARLVEAMARALPLWTARMAVALPYVWTPVSAPALIGVDIANGSHKLTPANRSQEPQCISVSAMPSGNATC